MHRKTSTSYLGNAKLKAAGVEVDVTEKELEEYLKCQNDPIHFIKNYVKIINLDRGEVLFKLYPFQEKMIHLFVDNRFSIVKVGRQCGKCVEKRTRINIRNRRTGVETNVSISRFYLMHKYPRLHQAISAVGNYVTYFFKSK